MGHVDHGKTSLLDYIRRTKVAAGEAGGITQHIGAYHVETPKGVISFLDTPGHAAFTAMRAARRQAHRHRDPGGRGRRRRDAADDRSDAACEGGEGAAGGGDQQDRQVRRRSARVKNDLLAHDVVAEEFGGDTQMVIECRPRPARASTNCSTRSAAGRSARPQGRAEGRATGVVIESALDKGRGPVATVLVQQGTLQKGDYLVCGMQYGRVRALFDETGSQVRRPVRRSRCRCSACPACPMPATTSWSWPTSAWPRTWPSSATPSAARRAWSRRRATAWKTSWPDGRRALRSSLNLVVKADVQGSAKRCARR
jgi:translation initiation factor IF-2